MSVGSSYRATAVLSLHLLARRARAARVAASSLLAQVARVCLVLAGKRALASVSVRDWVVAGCKEC